MTFLCCLKHGQQPCGVKNRLLPCAKQPNTFTIHGLWPQNHIGPQPTSCSNLQKDKFDKRIVSLSCTLTISEGTYLRGRRGWITQRWHNGDGLT